ncbi:MAG TPA: phage tail sheath subtilisin-like domain-containing protein [Candidatus Binataceae bacterium]|nr:phage tail sheath subtilisin-like domain-containing protein [Candidatus Binataceae bacterium]
MSLFHGVKVVEVNSGPVPILSVPMGVIGLVGSAPSWAVQAPAVAPAINTPTLVNNNSASGAASSSANFGPLIQGYTIPYALAAIQQAGIASEIIVVNVMDPTVCYTTVTNAALSMPASGPQVINLGHMGISSTATPGKPVVKNSGGSTTYVENTDYTVDYYNGLIIAKSGGSITVGEALSITYSYNDPSKVTSTMIIGGVSGGVYTGISALQTTMQSMGMYPRILIAPGFSQTATVQAALTSMAATLQGVCIIDSAPQTAVATAIANRGTSGQAFDASDHRTILAFPQQYITDNGLVPTGVTLNSAGSPVTAVAGTTSESPYSQWLAGVMASNDWSIGPWRSPSNTVINGVLGDDIVKYENPNSGTDDCTNLNSAGIVTTYGGFGLGRRVWGNRSSVYPSETLPENFIPIRRTADYIEISVIQTMLQFQDQPLTPALVDTIIDSINAFLASITSQGGLIAGALCSYNPTENSPTQLANGQLTLDIVIMPPPPMESLTFNVNINTNLLSNFAVTAQSASSVQA